MFTIGVVTHKTTAMPTKNNSANSFAKFEISDLRKYDDIITQMTKGKDLWKTEYETFKKFKLTESGYKVVNWILFGELALKLSVSSKIMILQSIQVGDVVALTEPKLIENKKDTTLCFNVKKLSSLIHIGTSKYFAKCKTSSCDQFLNKTFSKFCAKHIRKELEFSRQIVHSRRANFRSNEVYDPESDASQQINMLKISKMGFAKCNDFELTPNVKQTLPAGFNVREPVLKEEKVEITPELKRKCKENEKKAEEMLKNMLESRKRNTKFRPSNDFHQINTKESKFMQKEMKIDMKENRRDNFITFSDDEQEVVDVSNYMHLLKKPEPKKDVEKTFKFGLGKRLKRANFEQSKHSS